jgi:hypothetical protein
MGETMEGAMEGADITVVKRCAEGIALRKASQGLQMGLYNYNYRSNRSYRTDPTSGRL